ncbi:unnamed protein product [Cyprideis torosa]|uniref:Uncharacterized protein n=1 Tax=Cyprideis torosa TaxID=163714 RepID=A0A7R8WE13_9CRUS|nr:unnamed protein product [Cyprideis torosa]CAG0895294.1 unnamed protein product [Cyprideis torosa]
MFIQQSTMEKYFYAISEISIGGRCKCNGHADECEMLPDPDTGDWKLSCLCEHNTMGRDCEQCKPFHRNQPWRRANKESAHACEVPAPIAYLRAEVILVTAAAGDKHSGDFGTRTTL